MPKRPQIIKIYSKFTLGLLLVCTQLVSVGICQEDKDKPSPKWPVDFEAAQEKSANDGLPILIYFTGSDWCSPCKKLDKEVTGTEAFHSRVKGLVHLVKADLPNQPGIVEADQLLKNEALAKRYQNGSFPALLFVNSDGLPLMKQPRNQLTIDGISMSCKLCALRSNHVNELLKIAAEQEKEDRASLGQELLNVLGSAELVNTYYKKFVGEVQSAPAVANGPDLKEFKEFNSLLREAKTPKEQIAVIQEWLSDGKLNSRPLRISAFRQGWDAYIADNQPQEGWELAKKLNAIEFCQNPRTQAYENYHRLKNAIEEGDDALKQLVETVQNDLAFSQVLAETKRMAEPANRLAAFEKFEDKKMSKLNRQWLYIQIGFAHEGLEETDEAIEAFHHAIKEGEGEKEESANTRYANEQIERLKG